MPADNGSRTPRIVTPDRGVLVPVARPDQLAEAAGSLLADQARMRALGAAAARYVADHHSASTWGDRLLQIYRETASTPRRR